MEKPKQKSVFRFLLFLRWLYNPAACFPSVQIIQNANYLAQTIINQYLYILICRKKPHLNHSFTITTLESTPRKIIIKHHSFSHQMQCKLQHRNIYTQNLINTGSNSEYHAKTKYPGDIIF